FGLRRLFVAGRRGQDLLRRARGGRLWRGGGRGGGSRGDFANAGGGEKAVHGSRCGKRGGDMGTASREGKPERQPGQPRPEAANPPFCVERRVNYPSSPHGPFLGRARSAPERSASARAAAILPSLKSGRLL